MTEQEAKSRSATALLSGCTIGIGTSLVDVVAAAILQAFEDGKKARELELYER